MSKQKGSIAERDLVALFWENGWSAHRIAGSGSSKYDSPDVIAGKAERKIAIEAKITKETTKYFTEKEILSLQSFSSIFGAEPWTAVKFPKTDWLFISLEDLDKTEKNYKITLEKAKKKGLLFKELIS